MVPSAGDSPYSPSDRNVPSHDGASDDAPLYDEWSNDASFKDGVSQDSLLEPDAAPGRSRRFRFGAALRDVVEAVVLAVGIFVVLQLVIQNTVVEGSSMEPNFVNGERLLVNKLGYRLTDPKRGDVIVFHAPGYTDKDFIKRVVALPGDSVAIVNGTVRVNGLPLAEPWRPLAGIDSLEPYAVPEGHYFVLGDNRPSSNDSRKWEALPGDRIVGKVWLSVWPPETWGLVGADRPGPAAAEGDADRSADVGESAATGGRP